MQGFDRLDWLTRLYLDAVLLFLVAAPLPLKARASLNTVDLR